MKPTDTKALSLFSLDNVQHALAEPGWAILTATLEGLDEKFNVEANAQLERLIAGGGYVWAKLKGSYKGVDQGTSFLVMSISDREAMWLGNKFGQESVITHTGLLYTDGLRVQTIDFTRTLTGHEARQQPGYSVLPDGTAFSLHILDN